MITRDEANFQLPNSCSLSIISIGNKRQVINKIACSLLIVSEAEEKTRWEYS